MIWHGFVTSLRKRSLQTHVHILSLVVRYESEHKRSLTPLFGQRQNTVLVFDCAKRKENRGQISNLLLDYHFVIIFSVLVLKRVQIGTMRS